MTNPDKPNAPMPLTPEQATAALLRSMRDEAWAFQQQKRLSLLSPPAIPAQPEPQIMPPTALGTAELYAGLRGHLSGMKQGRAASIQYRAGRAPRWPR